jgi:hypothetical protein
VVVDLTEGALVRGLARERLDDAYAGDVLRQGRGDEPEALAHGAVGSRRDEAEERRRDRHEREDGERGERELPVEREEDGGRADEDEAVLEEARDPVRDELVQRLHVVGQAADDDAGAVPLVEAEREALEMPEEHVAQVGEDPLAGPAREVGLRRARRPVEDAGHEEGGDHDDERAVVLLAHAVIERELGQVRGCERGDRRREERDHGERRAELVGRRQAHERGDAPRGAPPGPVLDLGPALHGQVPARLPDSHGRLPLLARGVLGNPPPQPDGSSLAPEPARVAHGSCRVCAFMRSPPAAP